MRNVSYKILLSFCTAIIFCVHSTGYASECCPCLSNFFKKCFSRNQAQCSANQMLPPSNSAHQMLPAANKATENFLKLRVAIPQPTHLDQESSSNATEQVQDQNMPPRLLRPDELEKKLVTLDLQDSPRRTPSSSKHDSPAQSSVPEGIECPALLRQIKSQPQHFIFPTSYLPGTAQE